MELTFFLILSWITTVQATNGLPVITTPNNSRITTKSGDTITLPCVTNTQPTPITEWYLDKKLINTEQKRYKLNHQGLKIRGVTLDDAGVYVCRVVNGFGPKEIVVHLEINDDPETSPDYKSSVPSGVSPKISARPRKLLIQRHVGVDFKLRCVAEGEPNPSISWFKEGLPLLGNRAEKIEVYQTTVIVKETTVEDSGNYTCVAWNDVGRDNATFLVQIFEKYQRVPEITGNHPINSTVRTGEMAVLECRIHSETRPVINWYKRVCIGQKFCDVESVNLHEKKYQQLNSHEKKYQFVKSKRHSGIYINILQIFGVSPIDSGEYLCLASNDNGFANRSAFITVLPSANIGVDIHMKNRSPFSIILTVAIPVGLIIIGVTVLLICFGKRKQTTSTRPPPLPQRPPHLTTRVEMDNQKGRWKQYGVIVSTNEIENGYIQGRRMGSC